MHVFINNNYYYYNVCACYLHAYNYYTLAVHASGVAYNQWRNLVGFIESSWSC